MVLPFADEVTSNCAAGLNDRRINAPIARFRPVES
jgi:hypothetical protein